MPAFNRAVAGKFPIYLSIPKARRLHSREAVFQIGDDVVDVLCSDREADCVLVDACRVKLVVGEL